VEFDAYVTLSLGYFHLGRLEDAERELDTARSLDPARSEHDVKFLFAKGEVLSSLQIFRQVADSAPRFEIARWSAASRAEYQWRTRPQLEPAVVDVPFCEYQFVLDINPGNIGAWSNRGYMQWLTNEIGKAQEDLRAGRDYKTIMQETFVGELDYGLTRAAAETGAFQDAYRHYETALSAMTATTVEFRSYFFALVSPDMLARFERYKAAVEKHLTNKAKPGRLPGRILNAIYAFVLNDYGECCDAYYLRFGDKRWRRRAEGAFELARLFNPAFVCRTTTCGNCGSMTTESMRHRSLIRESAN
jgi:tetratricopeptide (TPR) repeat protein